jgi:hypothetical protein
MLGANPGGEKQGNYANHHMGGGSEWPPAQSRSIIEIQCIAEEQSCFQAAGSSTLHMNILAQYHFLMPFLIFLQKTAF